MKNLLLLFALFTIITIASAQNNNAKKQKENITFPELLVFTEYPLHQPHIAVIKNALHLCCYGRR